MNSTQPIIAFIEARIAELEKYPGAREATNARIFELKMLKTYAENLDRGEQLLSNALRNLNAASMAV